MNHSRDDTVRFHQCKFNKKLEKSVLRLTHMSSHRCIHCSSYYEFKINNKQCRSHNNQSRGRLYTGFYSGPGNIHRSSTDGGICERLEGGGFIPKGDITVDYWRESRGGGDKYYGWFLSLWSIMFSHVCWLLCLLTFQFICQPFLF